MCEGCGKHAWHTETLKRVQRDRFAGEVHVEAQETRGHVVGQRGAWQDMQENMEGQVWKHSRTRGEVMKDGGTWESMWKHGGDVGVWGPGMA